MTPLMALTYAFLFGLLHGILPDEHTWPITLSYAIGGASGKEGMKAGIYFSAAFTIQRMLVLELSYLTLAPFLFSPRMNGIVYIVVGAVMFAAGAVVLRRNDYPHVHPLGHHHQGAHEMETTHRVLTKRHVQPTASLTAPPLRWTLIHGFIAGFGFGGFSLFVNTVAAPAMPNAWLGFLPGFLFGLGTMITLIIVGALFGASLHWSHALTELEVKRIGAQTGGRTLFFGGLLFMIFGIVVSLGWKGYRSIEPGSLLISLFIILVAIPAFVYSWKEARALNQACL